MNTDSQKMLTAFYNVSPAKQKRRTQVDDDGPGESQTTKKSKTTTKTNSKEVSSRSTLSDLREIAISRGYEETSLPSTKADLKALLCLNEPATTTTASDSVKNRTITTKTIITTIKEHVIEVESSNNNTKQTAPSKEKSSTSTAKKTNPSKSSNSTKVSTEKKVAAKEKKWSMKSSLEELQDEAFLRNLPFENKKKSELIELLNGDATSVCKDKPPKAKTSSAATGPKQKSSSSSLKSEKKSNVKPTSKKTASSTSPEATRKPKSENESSISKGKSSMAEISKPTPVASCATVVPTKVQSSHNINSGAIPMSAPPEAVVSKFPAAVSKGKQCVKIKSEPMSSVPSSVSAVKDTSMEKLPRISNKLSMSELQEEAICRGYTKKELPKNKADLLHFLLDGSIHLKETHAWKEVTKIKNQMQAEKDALYQSSLQQKLALEQKKAEQQRAKMERQQREKEQRRQEEKDRQKKLHTISFPFVHAHLLAKTRDLVLNGIPRVNVSKCSICHSYDDDDFLYSSHEMCIYTCEECDFDICAACFKEENRSEEEKQKAAEQERLKRAQENKLWRERQKQLEEEQRELEKEEEFRWDANKQFSKRIIRPPQKNKKPDGNGMTGYTVWCSDGYEPDGWHGYEGEPAKEFDSTWKTATEANERARYLFFWKNSWGLHPNEVDEPDEETSAEGLKTYTVMPDDSTRWTVSVVPDFAFKYLDHATTERHNHDDEREPRAASSSYRDHAIFL
jgi:hypothetical protein